MHGYRVGPAESPADPSGHVTWDYQDWYQFGSEHPQRVLFAFGDGAVRGIDDNVDRARYIYISGMRDGRDDRSGPTAA